MDEIIDQIISVIQLSEQNIDDLSQEEMESIAQFINEAIALITEEYQAQQAPISTDISAAQYPSSNIFGFKHDPSTGKMMIKFMGKDIAEGGPVYEYDGVPDFIFDIIKRGAVAPKTSGKNKYHEWFRGVTPSHGASVNALIKKAGFNYRKVA